MNITPTNLVPNAVPVTALPSNSLVSVENGPKTEWTQYILPGVLVLIFLVLLYYAYCEFIGNAEKGNKRNRCEDDDDDEREGFVEGNRQERTDIVADFNLEESIKSLEQMQSKILRELSQDSGI